MIKIFFTTEKTNSWRPTPWNFSDEPFPAYRGVGQSHRAFLAVAKNYSPLFLGQPTDDGYSCPTECFDTALTKLIKTKEKGTLLLVPCPMEENEQIMLITLRGALRGVHARIEAVRCEVLSQQTSSKHCVETGHMIVRLTHPNGYVFAETGNCNRSSRGLVEIFSWNGYVTMSTEDFETWRELHHPDMSKNAFADGKAKAESDRKIAVQQARELQLKAEAEAVAKAEAEKIRKENAEKMRPILRPILEPLSLRLESIGEYPITFFETGFRPGQAGAENILEYTNENVEKIQERVFQKEKLFLKTKKFNELRDAAIQKINEELLPRAIAVGISIRWSYLQFVANRGGKAGDTYYGKYEDLGGFEKFIEIFE